MYPVALDGCQIILFIIALNNYISKSFRIHIGNNCQEEYEMKKKSNLKIFIMKKLLSKCQAVVHATM